ncbi:MAG: Gfo/Idh/MocA family oxidoreductase [Deltaproteobacteria bacterium]|nr:Gfo/Idh/MocA family oxidoreductase [Deltaproteobacteria bacterium]
MSNNFAVIGVAGYVAARHLRAIRDTGSTLVAAADPHTSVGILDQYSLDVRYFPEIERFDRHLEKLRRGPEAGRVHWVSICSPNYLHDAHIRMALRAGANALCEKPLVINPWNLDVLEELETETERRVFTVLQLRLHPTLVKLKEELANSDRRHDVVLSYVTARGPWYHLTWKGQLERSGGVGTNIGIHFFDLLLWLFGDVERTEVHLNDGKRMAGALVLKRATVRWFLSVEAADLPESATAAKRLTHRTILVDGREVEFSEGFTDLHTRVYQETLAGRGFGISVARPSVELVHRLRTAPGAPAADLRHPWLERLATR